MITELQIAERFPGTSQADRTFLNNAASFAKANTGNEMAIDMGNALDDLLGPESKSHVA
jgi:hypothetical protein